MPSPIRAPRRFRAGEVIRHAEKDEFDKVLALLRLAFPQVPSRVFETLVLSDPEYDPRYTLMVDDEGSFRAHLQIYPRSMVINGSPIRVGGIGNVGTSPACRRRGYATALVMHAIDLMKRDGFESSFLFTEIGDFYAKLGWVPIHRRFIELSVLPERAHLSPALSLEPVEKRHLAGIRALADSYHPNRTGRILRMGNHWRRPRPWAEEKGWAVLRAGSVAGFFFCVTHKDGSLLACEHAYRSGEGGLSPSDFFAALPAIAVREGHSHVLGHFLFDRGLREYLEQSTLTFQMRTDSSMMWRDLGRRDSLRELEEAAREDALLFWETDAF